MNPVTIKIFKAPADPNPTHQLLDIPWFAGITALQAMIIGEAMYEKSFSFRVVYRSIFEPLSIKLMAMTMILRQDASGCSMSMERNRVLASARRSLAKTK
jgi:hypothetical protein